MKYLSNYINLTPKKVVLWIMVAGILFFPFFVLANNQNFKVGQLPGNTGLNERDNLLQFISRIIKVALSIVGAILLVLIIYGGFTYATAAGNDEKVKKGRNIITYAIVGIVIIAIAWIITDFVIGNILLG